MRGRIADGSEEWAGCSDSRVGFIIADCGGWKRSGSMGGARPEKVAVGDMVLSQNRWLMAGAEMVVGMARGD